MTQTKKTETPQEISLRMDMDRVTLNDLIMLEDAKVSARELRDFLARCAVDGNGDPMGQDKAVEILGNLSISKIRTLAETLSNTLKEVGQVPPGKGKR